MTVSMSLEQKQLPLSRIISISMMDYWIIGGGSVVSKLVHECVTCRRLRAKVQEQKMADLPAGRLINTYPSFHILRSELFRTLARERRTQGTNRYIHMPSHMSRSTPWKQTPTSTAFAVRWATTKAQMSLELEENLRKH